jgi:thioredoxin-like negative regulator of GroEL
MGKKVYIAKIDATVHRKYAGQYKIKGFPTMLLFETDNK